MKEKITGMPLMQLVSGTSIKEGLREVMPTHVAAAYVGRDWRTYIDTSQLQEIVVSPTLGSNPYAIAEIAKTIGWENVHFLKNLHAKIYIGENAAAVGSFNLTANGLSAEVHALEEAGFIVRDSATCLALRTLYDRYKAEAKKQYRTTPEKKDRLKELRTFMDRGIANGLLHGVHIKVAFADYVPVDKNEIYICWSAGELQLNEEVVSEAILSQTLSFLESDEIKPDRWILCWEANEDGSPVESTSPYWIHIDDVVPHGCLGNPGAYTKLAAERIDRVLPAYPFELTKDVVRAFYHVLNSNLFPEFLPGGDESWSINPTMDRIPAFFAAWRAEVATAAQPKNLRIDQSRLLAQGSARKDNVMLSITNDVLKFAMIHLPGVVKTEAGKVGMWAAHLILDQSGYPSNQFIQGKPGDPANTDWVMRRIGKTWNTRHERTLVVLRAFAATAVFGKEVQYWAKQTAERFGGV